MFTPAKGSPPARPPRSLARLHVLVGDDQVVRDGWDEQADELCRAGGAKIALQLRVRREPDSRLFAWASRLARLARQHGTQLLVNDRVDIAAAVGADGVHLREDSMEPGVVRDLARTMWARASAGSLGGPRPRGPALLGRSIHASSQVKAMNREPIDYLVLGALYRTRTHPGRRPLPPGAFGQAAAASELPVLAIGGVGIEAVGELLGQGAYGVVVGSGVWHAVHTPTRAVAGYLECLGQA